MRRPPSEDGCRAGRRSSSLQEANGETVVDHLRGTKINSSDPPVRAVCAGYATPPLPPFFHPPIELASFRPHGRLDLDRRIDFSAICLGMLLHLGVAEIHI